MAVTNLYGLDGSGCPVSLDPPVAGQIPQFNGTEVVWVDPAAGAGDTFIVAATFTPATNTLTLIRNDGVSIPVVLQISDLDHHHVEPTPATTWTISHGFGRYPSGVFVKDSAGNRIIGDRADPDLDTTILTFSAAFSGDAFLS